MPWVPYNKFQASFYLAFAESTTAKKSGMFQLAGTIAKKYSPRERTLTMFSKFKFQQVFHKKAAFIVNFNPLNANRIK